MSDLELLDIPRVRRVPWLEPGDHVIADDVVTAEAAQEVRIELCEGLNRWSFLCVVAPLRLRAATGSPVNPIAIF
jgi:hypothetical protein